MKTFLITGSYGFIASNLLEFYAEKQNLKIISIGTNTRNLSYKFNLYKHDENIISLENLEALCGNDIPDVIIHCAGKGSVYDAKNIEEAKTSMIDTSIAVKNFADKYNVKRIIFLSSAAVYGNSLDGPKKQIRPISNYGLLKSETENLFLSMKNSITEIIILRLFSVYGPNLKKQLLFDAFKKFNDKNEPVFRGNGEQIRDFIHIQDVVKIINYYSFLDTSEKQLKIIDVGTGIGTKIRDLIKNISEQHTKFTGVKRDFSFDGIQQESDPISLIADKLDELNLDLKFIKIHDGVLEYAHSFYKDT